MKKRTHRPRSGAALLLLVVAILIVLMGATQALLRSEVLSQRNERERVQLESLQRALRSAQAMNGDWSSSLQLPVDDESGQLIVVQANSERTYLSATWMIKDVASKTIRRPIVDEDSKSTSENQ